MAKAFLSHSSKDKNLVSKIAIQLGKNKCHYDSLTFEAGQKTIEEIFKGLENTDIFVLFISNDSLNSEWVQKEISKAKRLSSADVIDRIFPIIIDKTISHNDPRIPDWIKKPYNIRNLDNEVLILKKIRQFLRESDFRKFEHLRNLNDLFVGRHELLRDFERKLVNIDDQKPAVIIASSFFDGIGRRTFLKNGLIKTNTIDKWYEPTPMTMGAKESIEDFIIKLSFIKADDEAFKHNMMQEELATKIKLAQNLIKKFVDNNEILSIVDEGSIILPNHTLVDWFQEVIKADFLQNQVAILLISKFKPYIPSLKKIKNCISFSVDELNAADTQTLFIQYLRQIDQQIKPEEIKFFLPYLKGIPSQIIYAANLIQSLGAFEAKKYVYDIEEFDELRAFSIFDYLKDDELSKQILIALSRFEIISHDLVYQIFGETEEVNMSIQKLFDLSLFFFVSSSHEYIKLSSSLADYINRSKMQLEEQYELAIKNMTQNALSTELTLAPDSDYSAFLFNIQSMIRNNQPVPNKLLIPSFLLKSIIKEYYLWNFDTVIQLCGKILDNASKFDRQIIWESKNWLCLAYARTQNEKFFEEVRYFKDDIRDNETLKDFNFLMGFFYRIGDRMEEAEEHYLEVLNLDENHARAKRELVNVYLRTGQYPKALNLAAQNYERHKTNILHIHGYFTCLVKKSKLDRDDLEMLFELIEQAKNSLDSKASDILMEMKAEYHYYVDDQKREAIRSLNEALRINPRNYFAYRSLLEMYKRENDQIEIERLSKQYSHLKLKE